MARIGSSEITIAVGEKIRERRKKEGWTVAAVADELPWGQSTQTRIEQGQLSITVEQLARIAAVYQCPIEALFPENWIEMVEPA